MKLPTPSLGLLRGDPMSRVRTISTFFCCLVAVVPVYGQPEQRGLANVIVSGTTIDGSAALGITGGFGYRFNRMLTVGIELTRLPSYDPDAPDLPPSAIPLTTFGSIIIQPPSYSFSGEEGRGSIFTANLRLDIPTRLRRLAPYLIGGAGAASLHEQFRLTIAYAVPIRETLPGFPVTRIFPPPVSYDLPRSTTDMAATLGGGVAVLVGEHFSFDVDARYIAVFGPRDLNLGRFGLGVSYRF